MKEINPQQTGTLSGSSSVLALIPHFRCEQWLAEAIDSLMVQSRPLEGIVVIDDGSPIAPSAIVEKFPKVTLLACSRNVGPYCLIQQVIQDTGYDAYLFQDADDWSGPDRLSVLLTCAERHRAELIGSNELRFPEGSQSPVAVRYPVDVNAALANQPDGHFQLHPSTLVSRDLVMRAGGFASGLQFGADTEFVHRVHYIARVMNVPELCYFRRKRRDSLTGSPDTGLGSPRRIELIEFLRQRARDNARRARSGRPPRLRPCAIASPVSLRRLAGPGLTPSHPWAGLLPGRQL